MILRAPFPWFGGKSRVADLVWQRFGDVPNYVEPFAGSLAVLLGRPTAPRIETVNDLDCYLANFWRAVAADPEAVAEWADWPVNEADLHARHLWLVNQEEFRERMKTDPEHFDARIAGWWVWGISQWIGSGWCSRPEWRGRVAFGRARGIHVKERDRVDGTPRRGRPALQAMGIHQETERKRPRAWGAGVHRRQIPELRGDSGAAGSGIHASGLPSRKLPLVGGTRGTGVNSQRPILDWFEALQARLRRVRVCCGDWRRVLGPSPTEHIGVTAVFLDPPYDPRQIAAGSNAVDGFAPSDALYSHHDADVSAEVRAWAIEHGHNQRLRIALCGYEGEHDELEASGWRVLAWKAPGGYGSRAAGGQGKRNAERERIWFSPACLAPVSEAPLFEQEYSA